MSLISQLLWNQTRRRTAQSNEEIETRNRRRQRTLQEEVEEIHDDHIKLLRAHHALKEEHERAIDLVRNLANSREAFRRLATHLRQTWSPDNPQDIDLKRDLDPLTQQKETEVLQDPVWLQQCEDGIDKLVRRKPPQEKQ